MPPRQPAGSIAGKGVALVTQPSITHHRSLIPRFASTTRPSRSWPVPAGCRPSTWFRRGMARKGSSSPSNGFSQETGFCCTRTRSKRPSPFSRDQVRRRLAKRLCQLARASASTSPLARSMGSAALRAPCTSWSSFPRRSSRRRRLSNRNALEQDEGGWQPRALDRHPDHFKCVVATRRYHRQYLAHNSENVSAIRGWHVLRTQGGSGFS